MLAGDSLAIRCAAASLILPSASSGPAFAYRPFDGTDAAVAAPGELEVELQPAGVQQEQGHADLDRAVDSAEFRIERRVGGRFRRAR